MILSDSEKALLGLASTEDLMKELIARFQVSSMVDEFDSTLNFLRAMTLQNILVGMDDQTKGYRTVSST